MSGETLELTGDRASVSPMHFDYFSRFWLTFSPPCCIIPNVSGCGEVWYRAWFGSRRPWVRSPPLRPLRVFVTNYGRPFFSSKRTHPKMRPFSKNLRFWNHLKLHRSQTTTDTGGNAQWFWNHLKLHRSQTGKNNRTHCNVTWVSS